MECKDEQYPASVTEEENINEAPLAHEMIQHDKRSTSEQSRPSSSSKISRNGILDLSALAKENRLKDHEEDRFKDREEDRFKDREEDRFKDREEDRFKKHEEELQIHEVNEQAKFILCLTNMLPKFIATIPPFFAGARDKRKLDTWLFKVEHYLDSIQVKADRLKISIATTLFDGFAADWWYNRTKHVREGHELPILSWERFVHIMEQTFIPAEARFTIQDKLAVLKQTGSVPSYIANFLSLATHLDNSSESDKVSRFINGLKPTPSFYLSSRRPTCMLDAIKLAEKWAYTCAEEGEILPCKRRKIMTRTSSPTKADRQPRYTSNTRVESNNHPNRPCGSKRLTEAEMTEYRKRGLCFNCSGHGHTFFQCSQRFP